MPKAFYVILSHSAFFIDNLDEVLKGMPVKQNGKEF